VVATCSQTPEAASLEKTQKVRKKLQFIYPMQLLLSVYLSNSAGEIRVLSFVSILKLSYSHTSIAYHKQLHPQRTVGTIGSVWQESTPSKETTGPAQTNTQSTKNHQEGHPLDSNQLTTCEGRRTKT